jgi:rhodanese-related sulfurtransferase
MKISHVLAILGSAFAVSPALAQDAPYKTVSSAQFQSASAGVTLVDVREAAEWAETGVPEGARKVSISRADFVDAVLAEVGGDKSKPVAVICRSGGRSVRAAKALTDAGFTNVTNVGDGMGGRDGVGQGWLAAGLPLAKSGETTR